MGQPHYGTEAEYNKLCDKYNDFLTFKAVHNTNKFFTAFFKEYFEEFPFEEIVIEGKVVSGIRFRSLNT